ncbi:MAG: family 78 glycoside hydrolase catalytic domain [Phycisphaerae bacterium]|nr:family 78 glycoside hydrolase catalytic domain [Phycisphaerae bacterium]
MVTALNLIGAAALAQSAAPQHLRCEYRVNPLGIDVHQPRLSWEVRDERRGAVQSAYQIIIAASEDDLRSGKSLRWDSGKVQSDQSFHVPYAGPPLKSGQYCFWQVRTWDADDKASPYSEPAVWSMGLLNPDDWKGHWIGKDEPLTVEDAPDLSGAKWIWYPEGDPAKKAPAETRYFQRTFTIPAGARILAAHLALTVDNSYELFINGQNVGSGSNHNIAISRDVREFLRLGDNMLAVTATNAGSSDNPAGLIGVLRVELEGQVPLTVHTDELWQASMIGKAASPDSDGPSWIAARVVGNFGDGPWGEIAVRATDNQRLPARMLRREFALQKPIKRATAYICGLGYYELYLNGEKVGDHVLDPGLTDYTKRALYATYDVTEQLQAGENAVGVMLGNGRYWAPRLANPVAMVTYGYPKLLMRMHVELDDGSATDIVSDGNWRLTADGPIRENNDYDGEVYDARMEQTGWSEVGFDDAGWEDAQLVDPPGGAIVAQMAEPIRITRELQPVQLTQPRPGVYVYDMGQNLVGWVRMHVEGPRGAQVKLRFAERLDRSGMPEVANLRSCKVTDTYILKGDGPEVYEPRFTYHGFRFVEVTGYPGTPTLDTLLGRAAHSDLPMTGAFSCSNELINRIHHNVIWGVRGNLRSIPTDCPQRDERQGWLGDIANQAKAEMYDFNAASFFAKWMNDIRDSQDEKGSIPDVAPAYWRIYSDNMTWPSAYLIIPRWHHEHYADTRLLAEHYTAMYRWLDYMDSFMKDGIMPRDQYGDWCVPPESPELIHSKDPARKTPAELLGTAYFYCDLRLLAEYATILGKTEDAKQFAVQAARLRDTFNERFLDREAMVYGNGSQTSSVLPLAFGLVPDDCHEAVFENLVDNIVNKCDGHLATGLVGGQWLMRVLSDNGRPDVAYKIATQRTYPSWGYMAEHGATTIWELWNGDSADPGMNSGNHLMLVGDLEIWFYEYLAGIRPDPARPAFKHFTIAPVCIDDLDWVRAEIGSMHGRVRSAWWREGGKLHLDVTVPPNTTARVHVPASDAKSTISEGDAVLVQAGTTKGDCPGVRFTGRDEDGVWFDVGAGDYRFVVGD